MRAALAQQLSGIDGVVLGELPDPAPAAGQALIRVHGVGVEPGERVYAALFPAGGGFTELALASVVPERALRQFAATLSLLRAVSARAGMEESA